jgi:hypothetical protein
MSLIHFLQENVYSPAGLVSPLSHVTWLYSQ